MGPRVLDCRGAGGRHIVLPLPLARYATDPEMADMIHRTALAHRQPADPPVEPDVPAPPPEPADTPPHMD